MSQKKIGVVALVTSDYSGNERAIPFFREACQQMRSVGIEVLEASRIAADVSDAVHICQQMRGKICGLVLIHVNWVMDSLQYIFTHELSVPTLLWALPYNETYSLACVHHYATVLKWQEISCSYVCGTYHQPDVMKKLIQFARVLAAIERMRHMRLGLVGPRQTWRVAAAQDMSKEELSFSRYFGLTILHVEMREVFACAQALSVDEVIQTRQDLLSRSGQIQISDAAMEQMVRMYLATKQIISRYQLDAIAAQTVPFDSGTLNLTASWLADEGYVVDTEGDISHTMLQYMLRSFDRSPSFLGEICSCQGDVCNLYHEGSSAHSLAKSFEDVFILPSGELGCYIGLSLKAMEKVTVADLVGNEQDYRMLITHAAVEGATPEEWRQAGSGCLAKLNFGKNASQIVDQLIRRGMDHHYVVQPGDYCEELRMLCDYLCIEVVDLCL